MKKSIGLIVLAVLLILGWVAAGYWQHTAPSAPSGQRVSSGTIASTKKKPIVAAAPKPPEKPAPPLPTRKETKSVLKKRAVKVLHAPVAKIATVRWQHWGAAPYAHSLAEACKKAPAAIDGTSLPQAVKEHFKLMLGSDCTSGTVVWLTPNEPLEQMWSGGAHPHVMNRVIVGELPVLQSPGGRSYRRGAVAEAAKAFEWSYVYEGKLYLWDIPLVCFNESWRFGQPVPSAERCVELSFNAPVGGLVRWGVGSVEGPLPPTRCNAQRQDSGAWTAWQGQCDICVPAIGYIRGILGDTAEIPHKYLYPVTGTRQTLRFSTAIWSRVVYLCIAYPDGSQSCGVYMRPQDWKGRHHVVIPDELWHKDEGNCPQ